MEANENIENKIEQGQPAEQADSSAAPSQPEPVEKVVEEIVEKVAEVIAPQAEEPKEEVVETPPVADEAEAAKPKVEPKWYVIQVMTGDEDKVKRSLDHTVTAHRLQEKVTQVLVPKEEIVEIKGGKRVEKIKTMFPGYVFLLMVLDEESWYFIRETAGVARFIGTKTKPTPVSGREMQRVLKQLGKEERLEITFEKGEGIRVISGPFRGYTGTVDDVNGEKGRLKVLISIFGRDTPVEVNFEHAQKIS